MENDQLNEEFYNYYAEEFDKIPFAELLVPLLLKYLPKKDGPILEVGAGVGALAQWLTAQGHEVVCLEPAKRFAQMTLSKGLNVLQTRLQDFFTDQQFNAVIAISSLIHISKAELPSQIKKIADMLTSNGIFIASFLEGEGEGQADPKKQGKMRFFSKYTQEELDQLLSPHFTVIESLKKEVRKMNQTFFLVVLKKK